MVLITAGSFSGTEFFELEKGSKWVKIKNKKKDAFLEKRDEIRVGIKILIRSWRGKGETIKEWCQFLSLIEDFDGDGNERIPNGKPNSSRILNQQDALKGKPKR